VSGLDGTETVVTAGVARLVDGSSIRIVTTNAPGAVTSATPQWKAAP
jgi:hypothetical protein